MENTLLAQYLSEDHTEDTELEVLINIALTLIDIFNKRVARQESERRNRFRRYIHNRTEALLSMNMLLHIAVDGNLQRRCWSLPKNRNWWENVMLSEWSDVFWLKHFRMTRSTFMDIAEQLRPFIEKEVTQMRTPITVEHRLAITLWRLATNIEYRSLGQQFGVGRSTVCSIVNETCRAIETHLMPKYIRFPEGQDLLDTVQQFRTKCKFPQVAGVIDCCHV
ncbi:uncharacterized protein LOC117124400, partial [Anneissia japonica]|uniref:uncharacterized protein LOC117124400 n=1 Tax=Anneissia japonica TaxID=1529436 RepID=UPI0014257EC5